VAREIDCLAEDGRLVIIAVQGGVKAEFNAGKVLRRRLTITGSTCARVRWPSRPPSHAAAGQGLAVAGVRADRPVIHRCLHLRKRPRPMP
jgi:threonine dehydrogenase-like Zn-dependent dehydrogenase